jgi:hypothetical protein
MPWARSTDAPQLEQLIGAYLARSSSIWAGDSGLMKFFSRRKLKNVIRRP